MVSQFVGKFRQNVDCYQVVPPDFGGFVSPEELLTLAQQMHDLVGGDPDLLVSLLLPLRNVWKESIVVTLFKKWATLGLFFRLFSSFSSKITIITIIKWEKCPSSAGIRTHDLHNTSNSPITTRPGLPPNYCYITLFLVGMEALYRPGRPPDLSFRVPVKHKMWSVT